MGEDRALEKSKSGSSQDASGQYTSWESDCPEPSEDGYCCRPIHTLDTEHLFCYYLFIGTAEKGRQGWHENAQG